MTIRFNGTELEEVRFNGVDCDKVYFNGELVFDKGATITVEELNGIWGARGTMEETGMVWEYGSIDGNPFPPFGDIYALGWGYGFIRVSCSNTSHGGRLKLTIGPHVRILNKHVFGDWGIQQTGEESNALPKSGTHSLKIEAIP